jgi:hypothetical protein
MKRTLIISAFLALVFVPIQSCRLYYIPTVNNNVCKRLNGHVVLYAIFVDTRYTLPWSSYDITSTLDSIKRAMKWIEAQAAASGIPLTIDIQYYQNKGMVPLKNDFPNRTLSGTLFNPIVPIGIRKLDRWADALAKKAGRTMPADTSKIVNTKNKLSDRERLIARIRDLNKTDNVVLMYFVNNYYKQEMSVSIHTDSFTDIEYSIVSFKDPSVIAHEFLHIFGALDLYINPFQPKKSQRKNKRAMKEFPNEIMAFAYRDISELNISPFTKYLIGWSNQLDDKYKNLVLGHRAKAYKF